VRLLIINQHAANHGDEAAGKALLRALDKENEIKQVDILYNKMNMLDEEKLTLETALCIIHHSAAILSLFDKAFIILSFLLPFWLIRILPKTPCLKPEFKLIGNADIVVSAPSGVNIGPYRDWWYLWRLYVALKFHKPLGVYSISFGPIPKNRLFKSVSVYVLRKAKFISLRDKQSQAYAEEYNIEYVPSIDTAFLDNTFSKNLPTEITSMSDRGYVVMVPNELYSWHSYYRNINTESLDKIYLDIINLFTNKGLDIVLLPQRFGSKNDSKYFERLRQQIPNKENINITCDEYSSDIQQSIVNNAKFLVGARYHSIVFAIRGEIPFVALSYEHKIQHMLSSLFLDKYAVDLKEVLEQESSTQLIKKIEVCFDKREMIKQELSLANKRANDIAKKTFLTFKSFLEGIA